MNSMILFVAIFFLVALILVASVIVDVPSESEFELERRKKAGEQVAEALLRRRQHVPDLVSLQRTAISLLLVLVVVLLVAEWQWVLGLVAAVVVALQYGVMARMPFIHSFAQKQYDHFEPKIIAFLEHYPIITKVTRTITTPLRESKLGSRDELLYLVSQAGVVLSADEKSLVHHALEFDTKTVREIMTPRSVIDSIGKNELLNPLVLDQLHKTGHSRFPVIDHDIDHVVGMLYLHDILVVDSSKKHTARVDSVMESKVYYVHEDQTLDRALAAFLRTHHHLFVVVNEYRETVGIVSLEDVIETLIGKKIVDEFDMHDDLRAVAASNPRGNNHASHGQDV